MLKTIVVSVCLFFSSINGNQVYAQEYNELIEEFHRKTDYLDERLLKNAPEDYLSKFRNYQSQFKTAEYNIVHLPQCHYVFDEKLNFSLERMDQIYKNHYSNLIDFPSYLIATTMIVPPDTDYGQTASNLRDIFVSQYMIYNEILSNIKNLKQGKKVTIFSEGVPYFGGAYKKVDEKLLRDLKFEYEPDSFISLIVNGAALLLKKQYPDKVDLVGTELQFIHSDKKNSFNKSSIKDTNSDFFSSPKEVENIYERCIDLPFEQQYEDIKCKRIVLFRQREANAFVSIKHYLNRYKTKDNIFLIYGGNHVFSDYSNSKIAFKHSNFDWKDEIFNRLKTIAQLRNYLNIYYYSTDKDFDLIYPFCLSNAKLALKKNIDLIPIYSFAHPDHFIFQRNLFLGSTFVSLLAVGFIFINSFCI